MRLSSSSAHWNITAQPVCVKCHPTLSSIVSHSLSINLEPWKKKSLLHVFPFVFSKSSPSKSYPFKSSPELFSDYWNPELHGHLWNAVVYNPNPLVYYVHVCWLLPAFLHLPLVELCNCGEVWMCSSGCSHTESARSHSDEDSSIRCSICLSREEKCHSNLIWKIIYREKGEECSDTHWICLCFKLLVGQNKSFEGVIQMTCFVHPTV